MMPKADKTLADYVVIALSPALIMALVGSLVFFLVEVLYVGQYGGRLLWVLFFFVFGSVLVARIAIEMDERRASAYGLVLAAAAWLGLQRFIEYPAGSPGADFGWAIHLGLIAVIWWSANRLTWDCTMIDDEQDASGEGVLEAAGLEQRPDAVDEKPEPAASEEKPSKRKKQESDLQAWWQRYQRYREERRRRPHVPGVWVVYFSLAALPLYGLGQSLIPPGETDRRRYAFWLMSIYVASGLGLLLTTSFLGLRRYLRQKNVQMPVKLTGVWLALGAALIGCFLVCGSILPRPAAEYALIELPWRAGAKEREASQFAQHGNEPGKDDGRQLAKGKDEPEGADKDRPGSKGQGGKDKKGSPEGKDQASGGGSKGKDDARGKGSTKDKGAPDGRKDGGGEKAEPKKDEKGEKGEAKKEENAKGAGRGDAERKGGANPPPPNAAPPALPEWIAKLAGILKWVVLAIFIVVILFFVLRALLLFLANFTSWARNLLDFFRDLWQRLGGGPGSAVAGDEPQRATVRRVPFRMFSDPFASRQAPRMSPAELVRYTFEALEAWAADRALARRPGETPLEFAERLTEEVPQLEDEARQLATWYASVAYARQPLADDCLQPLRELWQALIRTARQPTPSEVARR
jgi:hypothetical protein